MSNILDLQALSAVGADDFCLICLSWVSSIDRN
jgi:hypothetical protein